MASVSISKPSKVLGGHNMLILGLIREELKCDTFQIKLILHICSSCKHKSVTLFPWIFYRHLDLSSWWTVPRSDDVPYTHCLVNIETCEITTTISILFPTISNHCRSSTFRWSCWLVGRKTTITKITTHYTTERCDARQGAVRCGVSEVFECRFQFTMSQPFCDPGLKFAVGFPAAENRWPSTIDSRNNDADCERELEAWNQ